MKNVVFGLLYMYCLGEILRHLGYNVFASPREESMNILTNNKLYITIWKTLTTSQHVESPYVII